MPIRSVKLFADEGVARWMGHGPQSRDEDRGCSGGCQRVVQPAQGLWRFAGWFRQCLGGMGPNEHGEVVPREFLPAGVHGEVEQFLLHVADFDVRPHSVGGVEHPQRHVVQVGLLSDKPRRYHIPHEPSLIRTDRADAAGKVGFVRAREDELTEDFARGP